MEFIFKKDTSTENAKSGETSFNRTATLNHSSPNTSVKVDILVKGNSQEVAEFLASHFQVSKVNDRTDATFKLVARQTKLDLDSKKKDSTDFDEDKKEEPEESEDTSDNNLTERDVTGEGFKVPEGVVD